MIHGEGYMHALRWLGLRRVLYDTCLALDLDLNIKHEDKGLIITTIYFDISGKYENLLEFEKWANSQFKTSTKEKSHR